MNNNATGDFTKYYQLIMKRKQLFVAVSCSVITLVIAIAYALPNKYQAKSTVFIERNVINSLIEGIAVTSSIEDRLSVLDHSIKSRTLLLKVLDELGVDVAAMDQDEEERTIKYFQKKTYVDIERQRGWRGNGPNLFTVSYSDKDPAFARDYINMLVRRYIEENIIDKKEEASVANAFLLEQIDHFKEKIDRIDEQIIAFRKDKGIFIVMDEKNIVDEIKKSEEKLEELKINKMELEAKRKMIERQLKGENPYTVTIKGIDGNTMAGRLAVLQNRRDQLLSKYTENYPDVVNVTAEIEVLKEKIKKGSVDKGDGETAESGMSMLNPLYQQLKEELGKNELELAAVMAKEKHLRELIDTKKSNLKNIPAEKKVLGDLERDRDSYKKTYDQLVQRLGKSEVSTQMEAQDKAATFRIVDPAILPVKPEGPNRIKIIIAGVIASLGLAFGTLLILDNLDKSVASVDVLRNLEYPILTIIPAVKTQEETERSRKKDMMAYAVAGFYGVGIFIVMVAELVRMKF